MLKRKTIPTLVKDSKLPHEIKLWHLMCHAIYIIWSTFGRKFPTYVCQRISHSSFEIIWSFLVHFGNQQPSTKCLHTLDGILCIQESRLAALISGVANF